MNPIPIDQWPGFRVLTVREPWASLIVSDQKPVENRPRKLGYKGPLLIHAGAWISKGYYNDAVKCIRLRVGGQVIVPTYEECLFTAGRIIGGCTLTDCTPEHASDWYMPGNYALALADAWHADTLVEWKGQLSLGTYGEARSKHADLECPRCGGMCKPRWDTKDGGAVYRCRRIKSHEDFSMVSFRIDGEGNLFF